MAAARLLVYSRNERFARLSACPRQDLTVGRLDVFRDQPKLTAAVADARHVPPHVRDVNHQVINVLCEDAI